MVSLSGCSQECWKDVVQKACCPGYWGSQCYGTKEAASPAPVILCPSPQLLIRGLPIMPSTLCNHRLLTQ